MKAAIDKIKINKREIVTRLAIFLTIICAAFFSRDTDKQIISSCVFTISFLICVYMHKYFFPWLVLALTFYLAASVQQLWNQSYEYMTVTKIYWAAGNLFMLVGFIDFCIRLKYKYKIVDHVD